MAEGFDWVHIGGAVGGVKAEGDTDGAGYAERKQQGRAGDYGGHTPEMSYEEGYGAAEEYADHSAREGK